jgi:hypothetical protein
MTPNERYEKFLANHRKVTKFYFEHHYDLHIARQGMYRLRTRKKETFNISSSLKEGTLILEDKPF